MRFVKLSASDEFDLLFMYTHINLIYIIYMAILMAKVFGKCGCWCLGLQLRTIC